MTKYPLILVGSVGVFGWSGVASPALENESVVAGLLDGSTYDVLDAALEKPVLLKFWATSKRFYAEEFADLIDEALAKDDFGSNGRLTDSTSPGAAGVAGTSD